MDQKMAVLFMPDNMALTEEQDTADAEAHFVLPHSHVDGRRTDGGGALSGFLLCLTNGRTTDDAPYVPENADVVYVDGARHGEELLTLLKDEKGSVLIVNGAVLPVGVFSGGAVYSADAKECCKVLKSTAPLPPPPQGGGDHEGLFARRRRRGSQIRTGHVPPQDRRQALCRGRFHHGPQQYLH